MYFSSRRFQMHFFKGYATDNRQTIEFFMLIADKYCFGRPTGVVTLNTYGYPPITFINHKVFLSADC